MTFKSLILINKISKEEFLRNIETEDNTIKQEETVYSSKRFNEILIQCYSDLIMNDLELIYFVVFCEHNSWIFLNAEHEKYNLLNQIYLSCLVIKVIFLADT